MDRIERLLWIFVAIVYGNLAGTWYQTNIVQQPVKHERKGELRKVAEETTAIACVSKEVGQAVLDAYKVGNDEGEITLLILIMLGACEIAQPEPEKVNI